MKEQLKTLIGKLSASDFGKLKQLYRMTNGIKGETIRVIMLVNTMLNLLFLEDNDRKGVSGKMRTKIST